MILYFLIFFYYLENTFQYLFFFIAPNIESITACKITSPSEWPCKPDWKGILIPPRYNDIPFINIKSINLLAKNIGLYPPDKSIVINQGPLFYIKKDYNIITIIVTMFLSLLSIGEVEP